jgi:cystathionine gamma-lyase
MVIRGTKTLAQRMLQHNINCLANAELLAAHPKVRHDYYPGLPTHPQHQLARKQMRGFGGMVTCELGSLEAARRLLNGVRLMALAESLGGVETLISHPATMTHASVPATRRAALGISDGLVRISAGIEDIEDLQADLEQALDRV